MKSTGPRPMLGSLLMSTSAGLRCWTQHGAGDRLDDLLASVLGECVVPEHLPEVGVLGLELLWPVRYAVNPALIVEEARGSVASLVKGLVRADEREVPEVVVAVVVGDLLVLDVEAAEDRLVE